jgi:hypothetical protein
MSLTRTQDSPLDMIGKPGDATVDWMIESSVFPADNGLSLVANFSMFSPFDRKT